MTLRAHRAIIEAGPGTVRRLCCGTSMVADAEMSQIYAAALDAIDDQVALVDGRPVTVASLWHDVLRSLNCGSPDAPKTMVVVHPSWWPASRVGVVTAAAKSVTRGLDDPNDPNDVDHVVPRPRSWLLTRASDAAPEATVVVEIAERLVAISGDLNGEEVVAVPRRTEPQPVAGEVASVIGRITRGMTSVVLIDAPSTVVGAPGVATLIAAAIRDANSGQTAVVVDDARLPRLARSARLPEDDPAQPAGAAGGGRSRAWKFSGLAAAGVVLAVAVPAVAAEGRQGAPATEKAPTTFLVEGRVALTVPANWPTQRVVAGPGSARVQITSPSDPEVAIHVTQSPVPDDAHETLSGAAVRLKRAIDAEPAGVFVDFNPSGVSAGRAAVTYREVRAGHHVRWTVLLDGTVRISIGCQSRPGGEDAVREVCEQAVRSAHAFG
jgi:type VII secretion-associated protein (TIGR03931 family)